MKKNNFAALFKKSVAVTECSEKYKQFKRVIWRDIRFDDFPFENKSGTQHGPTNRARPTCTTVADVGYSHLQGLTFGSSPELRLRSHGSHHVESSPPCILGLRSTYTIRFLSWPHQRQLSWKWVPSQNKWNLGHWRRRILLPLGFHF